MCMYVYVCACVCLVCSATRFRWTQTLPLYDKGNSSRTTSVTTWAIDDVYIGHLCPLYCHGHGHCNFPHCVCDDGYTGVTCDLPVDPLQVNYLTITTYQLHTHYRLHLGFACDIWSYINVYLMCNVLLWTKTWLSGRSFDVAGPRVGNVISIQ